VERNQNFIPNYGERYRHGEKIASGFVESAVNQVKRRQMQWTQRGAHLLLQIRTRVLKEEWEDTFRRWYPGFRPRTRANHSRRPLDPTDSNALLLDVGPEIPREFHGDLAIDCKLKGPCRLILNHCLIMRERVRRQSCRQKSANQLHTPSGSSATQQLGRKSWTTSLLTAQCEG
jgi:hypothetical protein